MATQHEAFRPGGGLEWHADHRVEGKESATLACTVNAVNEIDHAFEAQKSDYFYPFGISNEEIKDAARINPAILSHYTVVRKSLDGSFVAIPYSRHYHNELKHVIDWIHTARESTRDKRFGRYLDKLSLELADGEQFHESAVEAWLDRGDEPEVDLVCGPIDRYQDKKFNVKFAFQGWTGRLNREKTQLLHVFLKQQSEVWHELASMHSPSAALNPKVRIRVDDTHSFGGLVKYLMSSANNLPCEQELRDRYGAKITLLEPSFKHNLIKRVEIMKKIIKYEDRKDWSDTDIEDAGRILLASHEWNHSVIRRNGDDQRLGNEYAYLNEMYATSLGLWMIALRNDISDKMKNIVLGVQLGTIVEAFREDNENRASYLNGYKTILNLAVERGLLRIDNSGFIRWDDGNKVLGEIGDDISTQAEMYCVNGTKDMVNRFRRGSTTSEYLEKVRT